jgi:hypothetical protein
VSPGSGSERPGPVPWTRVNTTQMHRTTEHTDRDRSDQARSTQALTRAAHPGPHASGLTRAGTGALLAAAAALLLSACGGSSSNSSSSTTGTASADNGHAPVQTARDVHPVPRALGAGKIIPSQSSPVKARQPSGSVDDEINASGAKTVDPCTLVTREEAQTIVGKPVGQPVDAPQGPTCIYGVQGAKAPVTLAVQSLHFSTVKPQSQLHDRITLSIAGHSAYCGVAGTPTLIVPLSAGRFLSVVAPCPIAASFATKALGRIG